jgi:hypothetical protein
MEASLPCLQEPITGPLYSEIQVYFNIVVPLMPKSYKLCFFFKFSNKNSVCISHLSYAFSTPGHLILLDFIILIWWTIYKLCSSSLCIFLHPPVTSSLLGPNILLSSPIIFVSILSVHLLHSHPCTWFAKDFSIKILYAFLSLPQELHVSSIKT